MDLSEFIVNAMKYIDCKLEKINSESINRPKVRSMIKISIVSNAKKLMLLNSSSQQNEIDYIFRKCLSQELLKNKGE